MDCTESLLSTSTSSDLSGLGHVWHAAVSDHTISWRLRRLPSGGLLRNAGMPRHGSQAVKQGNPSTGSVECPASTASVLLAEDNAINMKVAVGILSRMGYKKVRASYLEPQLAVDSAIKSCHLLGLCSPLMCK